MILTIVALLADTVARVSTVWANHGAQFKCFCSCIGCFITEGTCPILRHYLPVQSLLLLYFVWLYTEALSHWNSASCCHFHGPYNGPLWCKCAKHTLSMRDSLHLHVCWLSLTANNTDSAYIHHTLSIWAMKQSWVDLPDMCIRAHSCTMVIHCHLNHNFFFFLRTFATSTDTASSERWSYQGCKTPCLTSPGRPPSLKRRWTTISRT